MGNWLHRLVECREVCTQTLWSAAPVGWGWVGEAGGELAVEGRAGRRVEGECSALKSPSLLLFQQ